MAVRTESLPSRFLNRELSWLTFNERVLDLASDPSLPLLERVKFCAIFSSNLDEFFMVRVAGLLEQAAAGVAVRSADGMTPQQTLTRIHEDVTRLTAAQGRLWRRELRPALAEAGIEIGRMEDCRDRELEHLEKRFKRDIYPVLTPLAVGPGQPFPYISGLSLSLGLFARDPSTGEERLARVKVPEGFPRFMEVGHRGLRVPLEQVINHFLPALFPGVEIDERASFRVTRDADFTVSDDADDLLEAVESQLSRRRFGDIVRVEVSASASDAMVARLGEGLNVGNEQLYRLETPLDLSELTEIVAIDRPDLKDEPWSPVTSPRLATTQGNLSRIFEEIRHGDVFVHQPYESFTTSFDAFAQAAAQDPDVIAMKTAVYRTSDDSALVGSLVECAEDGKETVCLVELKARFEERKNIEWSRALEQAGVHVVYGFADLKIHAKMTLIVRRDGDGLRRYAHIGTGNYHAATARLYEDVGIFTADEDITADIADLFNYVTGFGRPQRFRKLLVAPTTLRPRLIEEVRAVTQAAADGEPARIRLKLNQLVDPEIIEELYAASQAGVQVQVAARSICMLRPGVQGMSEHITVRSLVGRFLEHSRIYSFERGDESTMYIGSADMMPRNLDRRIEVLAPVLSARVRHELKAVLDSAFKDDFGAWLLQSDGTWERAQPESPTEGHRHQGAMMRRAQKRARRAAERRRRGS
jgi:polyphosphate kinase